MASEASIADDSSRPRLVISQAPDASDSSVTERMTNASPKRAWKGWAFADCRAMQRTPLKLRFESLT